MKKENKINLKFNRENFDIIKIKNSIFEFFLNHSEIIFMIFFIVMAALSGLLIYKYIYSSVWDEERKNAYSQELKKGDIDFKLEEFNAVIDGVKSRAYLYEKENLNQVRDIFGIEK
ncbi:MAG: hypothetical protein ACWGHO_03635 [Candidatus Moraniibacteriota bacterium]